MKPIQQDFKIKSVILTFLISIWVIVYLISVPYRSTAQIVYTDINPDTILIKSGVYNLDINIDGLEDFQISVSNDSIFPFDKILCLHDRCYVSQNMIEGCYIASALELNDSVEKTNFLPFQPEYYQIAYFGPSYCMHSGHFAGTNDKYIGLKFLTNEIVYYGWLRLDVASDASSIKLKDYAYSSSGILAGQVLSSIDNKTIKSRISIINSEREISIIPNGNLILEDSRLYTIGSLSFPIHPINNKITIRKSQYPVGLYVLHLNTLDGYYTIKMLIDN
jgi:hypothetical protein